MLAKPTDKMLAKMLAKAIAITSGAFVTETDRGGTPYIMHCLYVMDIVRKKTSSDSEMMMAAVLHDLIEDTHWTFDELKMEGFSPRVIRILTALTHMKGESYYEYIMRVKDDGEAYLIKLADLKHNMDPTRMKGVRIKDFVRIEKYHKCFAFLSGRTDTLDLSP